MSEIFCDDLQELTRQESGIILFDNGEAIACNWNGISGIPRLSPLGNTVMGLGEQIPIVEPEHTENMRCSKVRDLSTRTARKCPRRAKCTGLMGLA